MRRSVCSAPTRSGLVGRHWLGARAAGPIATFRRRRSPRAAPGSRRARRQPRSQRTSVEVWRAAAGGCLGSDVAAPVSGVQQMCREMEGSSDHACERAGDPDRCLGLFVELLSQVEDDASSDAFYGRLCEATCALTSMDRAVIFLYDEVAPPRARGRRLRDRPRARSRDAHVTVESAPVARSARGGPRDRGRRRRRRRGARGVPRAAAPTTNAGLHAARRGRPLVRRDPVRPRRAAAR